MSWCVLNTQRIVRLEKTRLNFTPTSLPRRALQSVVLAFSKTVLSTCKSGWFVSHVSTKSHNVGLEWSKCIYVCIFILDDSMYHHIWGNMRQVWEASGPITKDPTIYISQRTQPWHMPESASHRRLNKFNKCFPVTICYVSYVMCLSAELNDIKRRQSLRKIGVTMLSQCFGLTEAGPSISSLPLCGPMSAK